MSEVVFKTVDEIFFFFAGYTNLGADRGTSSPLFSISVSGSGLEGATICSSDKSPLLGPAEAPVPQTPVTATPKCWRNIYYLLDLYTTTPETKTVQQRYIVGEGITFSEFFVCFVTNIINMYVLFAF